MDTTRWDADLEQYINEAAFNMDSVDSFIVSCETIDIECAEAKLPEGATQVIGMRFPDGQCSGCCTINTDPHEGWDRNMTCNCGVWWIFDKNVLTNFMGNGVQSCFAGNYFSIQNGYIKFPSTITATSIKVWFRGYNMDSDGIMILDERQQRGLSAYAAWQFATSGMHYSRYNPNQVQGWQREWVNQKARLVGLAAQDDFRNDKLKFSAIMNAMLVNPFQAQNLNL